MDNLTVGMIIDGCIANITANSFDVYFDYFYASGNRPALKENIAIHYCAHSKE